MGTNRSCMAGESVGGWIYYEETSHRVHAGFKASSEKVKSINHRALGPEFHHFFKLQSFLPSVLEEEEGLKTDHDKDPEYEEAWTDTFYDLFLVAMMSKVTRMVLEGITSKSQFTDVPNGVQDFQNFWHYGAVIGFILAVYADALAEQRERGCFHDYVHPVPAHPCHSVV